MRALQDALRYHFQDEALLRLALTHPSTKEDADNQRLEFLGDALLGFLVGELLFQKYADRQEGDLTARRATLVCEETLSSLARGLGVGKALRVGHGEDSVTGRQKPSILADAMEAIIAAAYLDGGITAARALVERLYRNEEALSALRGRDDKGLLQAYTQAREMGLPIYALLSQTGPAHARRFAVEVRIAEQPIAVGEGTTKKAAEQAAARGALRTLQTNEQGG